MTVSSRGVVCPNTEGVKLWEFLEVARYNLDAHQSQSHSSLGSVCLQSHFFLVTCQLHQDWSPQSEPRKTTNK